MMMDHITSNKYKEADIGNAMLGFGASLLPSGGYAEFSTMLPFVIAFISENAGIPCDMLKLVNSLPNRDIIRKCVTRNAIDTVILNQDSVQGNHHVYLSSDKGNKEGRKNLANFICLFDHEKNKQIK